MKIFIFGSNGMLGNYIKSYLSKSYEIISLTRKDYDLSKLSIDTLTTLLNEKNLQKDDIVINCAGVISPNDKFSANLEVPSSPGMSLFIL